MQLVQLTDIHIGREEEDTRNVDVRGNFRKALQQIVKRRPDQLIISGDLCYMEGEAGIYAWIRNQLDDFGLPFSVIPGNHDASALLADSFGHADRLQGEELYYAQRWGNWLALFLDSARGHLSADQKHWLAQSLHNYSAHPALVFIHHPPCLAGVPYMDARYALEDRNEVLAIFKNHPLPVEVFCGHYHVEKSLRIGGVGVHITPSTFFQIDMQREDFAVDHYRVGYRRIWLEEERLLHTIRWD